MKRLGCCDPKEVRIPVKKIAQRLRDRRSKQVFVSNSRRTAEKTERIVMQGEHFVDLDEERVHQSASFRNSSSWTSNTRAAASSNFSFDM